MRCGNIFRGFQKVLIGGVLIGGLVTAGATAANAVDPSQCVESPVTAKNVRVTIEASARALHDQMFDDVLEWATHDADKDVEAWLKFKTKYKCLLSPDELDDIFMSVTRMRRDVIETGTKVSVEAAEDVLRSGSRGIAGKAAKMVYAKVAGLGSALAGQVFTIGSEKACKQCTGALVKAGTKETLKRVGIGLAGAALGLAARHAFGAYGYIADATQCGMDDMIQVEYTELHQEYLCEQAKSMLNCPGRSTNLSGCLHCCGDFNNYPNQELDGGVAMACEKQCREAFPPQRKFCSNKAGNPNARFNGAACQ